jgi:hypothetical protein
MRCKAVVAIAVCSAAAASIALVEFKSLFEILFLRHARTSAMLHSIYMDAWCTMYVIHDTAINIYIYICQKMWGSSITQHHQ